MAGLGEMVNKDGKKIPETAGPLVDKFVIHLHAGEPILLHQSDRRFVVGCDATYVTMADRGR